MGERPHPATKLGKSLEMPGKYRDQVPSQLSFTGK